MKKITIDERTLKHSDKGTFQKEKNQKFILKGGGHGQSNINFLKKIKQNPKINYSYSNGVRLGCVPCHKNIEYAKENSTKQAWFPKNWNKFTIKKAGQNVLDKTHFYNEKKQIIGYYKGVKLGIYVKNGKVNTIFPRYNQKWEKL